jgi:hypothetical protein
MYGCGFVGTVPTFWRGITGELLVSRFVFPGGLVPFGFMDLPLDCWMPRISNVLLAEMINIYRDIRLLWRMLILRENR